MIGIDTNILVRYLVKDDLDQAATAARIIEGARNSGESIYIGTVVLCELVWVLDSAYECSRSSIISVLKQVLSTKQFEIERSSIAWQAVDDFASSRADFADCLIARTNTAAGCSTTFSFDKGVRGLKGFEIKR